MSKILYVEDSRDTAEAVKIILGAVGHKVELAYTGREGLNKLKKGNFDLVILDVMLPDITGMDLFGKVKGDKTVKKTKYAFLSINPVSMQKLSELKKDGVKDYISKPFKKEDLIKRVQKMLDAKK